MLLIHLVSHHVRRLMSLRPHVAASLVSAEVLSLRITESLSFQQCFICDMSRLSRTCNRNRKGRYSKPAP
jgi:hypothetical protein